MLKEKQGEMGWIPALGSAIRIEDRFEPEPFSTAQRSGLLSFQSLVKNATVFLS
jgi:hypothetical protein